MIAKIYNIIREIKLSSPKNADILIFNESGSELLGKYILFDLKYEIFYNGIKNIQIGPKVLYYLLKWLVFIHQDSKLKIKSKIYRSYILAYFECVKPKVIITFIDNNPLLDWIADRYEKSNFYVIQNALRITNEKYNDKHCRPELTSVDNFICFGEKEKNYYIKSGSRIKKFHTVGSLKGSIYKYYLNCHTDKLEYSICFVSQYRAAIMETDEFLDLKEGFNNLVENMRRFIYENDIKFAVAYAKKEESEDEYFKKYFGDKYTPIYSDYDKFSVYEAMDLSQVIVSFHSTASVESFGWGKKNLLCNYSGNPLYDFSLPDICTCNKYNYDEFEYKLKNLLNMDIEEYNIKTHDSQKYTMNYDPYCPVNIYVRNLILKDLDQQDRS